MSKESISIARRLIEEVWNNGSWMCERSHCLQLCQS